MALCRWCWSSRAAGFRSAPSTVYTILYKMEQDGLIEVVSEVERRKVYRITAQGRAVLEAETGRISELARFARHILECELVCAALKG